MNLILVSLGDNIHTIRWANAFAERGWKVLILSTNNKVNTLHKQHDNVRCITYQTYIGKKIETKIRERIINHIKLRNKLKKEKYDILHIHFIKPYTVFFLGLRNLIISLWGKDIIWDYNYKEPFIKVKIKKYILKKVKYISVTSLYLKETAIKYYPKCVKKIKVIPFGVDLNKFKPQSKKFSNSTIKIIFVKHFEEKYGPLILLKAFKILLDNNKNLKLLLIGSGQLEQKIKNFILENKISEYVEMKGKIPHETVIEKFDKSDIFVMPSVYNSESFGVAAIEASALELPVIVTNVGGVPEVVINNKTGLLIEPNNVKLLAQKIQFLIDNQEKAIEYGKAGRKFIEEKYDWEKNVESMELYYRQILKTTN